MEKALNQIAAEIISIGDELLIGQTINTNAAWLGEQLNAIGIKVNRTVVISDSREEIKAALDESSSRSEIIIMTGGLGPTKDDITKHTLCSYFNTELIMNEAALARITEFFEQRGLPMLEVNRQQAALPAACTVIHNFRGTACGMWFERGDRVFISMPGVPYEMKGMMEDEVFGKLAIFYRRPVIRHRTVLTTGVGESFLADKLKGWEKMLEDRLIALAYLPSPGMVKLRMSSYQDGGRDVERDFHECEQALLQIVGEHVYGYDKDTLQDIVGELLRSNSSTLAIAESCTGGTLSRLITSVAGASDYYRGGVIAYNNEIKIQNLHIDAALIAEKNVVSHEVARAMAEGVRKLAASDWAIATTGIAGPGGGTESHPVGLIYVAVAGPMGSKSIELRLGKRRENNMDMASFAGLNLLRKEILGQKADL
ncbi:MAG: competence/damage-inducible protein A [Flavobacteriales bacterium]